MLRLDWQLTLALLAIVPLLIGTIYFFAKRIRTQSTTIQEQDQRIAHADAGRIEFHSHGARIWSRRI